MTRKHRPHNRRPRPSTFGGYAKVGKSRCVCGNRVDRGEPVGGSFIDITGVVLPDGVSMCPDCFVDGGWSKYVHDYGVFIKDRPGLEIMAAAFQSWLVGPGTTRVNNAGKGNFNDMLVLAVRRTLAMIYTAFHLEDSGDPRPVERATMAASEAANTAITEITGVAIGDDD